MESKRNVFGATLPCAHDQSHEPTAPQPTPNYYVPACFLRNVASLGFWQLHPYLPFTTMCRLASWEMLLLYSQLLTIATLTSMCTPSRCLLVWSVKEYGCATLSQTHSNEMLLMMKCYWWLYFGSVGVFQLHKYWGKPPCICFKYSTEGIHIKA